MNTNPPTKSLKEAIETYVEMAKTEFHHRWEHWQLDLSEQEIYEVIGALMARQTTLAIEFARSPQIWNEHIAPLILRPMVDNYITLAWIFNDPLQRARQFIEYGLGREKLQIEHLKAEIKQGGGDPDESILVEAREKWIDAQKYTFLTEVDVGSWSGIDTRKMAEEVDCLDIYNNVYQPLSSIVHNMWNHVGKFNLKVCRNPLHKYHFIPYIPELEPKAYFLAEASELLKKTFELFDKKVNNTKIPPSAHEELMKLFGEQN